MTAKKTVKKSYNPPHPKAKHWLWRLKKAGLRQEDFVQRDDVNVPLTSFNRWARLAHNPPADAAQRIEAALKILKV